MRLTLSPSKNTDKKKAPSKDSSKRAVSTAKKEETPSRAGAKASVGIITVPPDYNPVKDKGEFMNPVMSAYFRQKLILWREELNNAPCNNGRNPLSFLYSPHG